jgi:hypothetical protein
MPCDTDHDVSNVTVFNELLNDVSTIFSTLDFDHAIVGGDLNTDLTRLNSWHTAALQQLLIDENMSLLSHLACYDVDYTYESRVHSTRSTLDHFMVTEQLTSSVQRVQAHHSALNASDHSVLQLVVAHASIHRTQQRPRQRHPHPLWHKATDANITDYRLRLADLTDAIAPPIDALRCETASCEVHHHALNDYYQALVSVSLNAGRECIPHRISHPTTLH